MMKMTTKIEMDCGARIECESLLVAEAKVFEMGLSLGPLWKRETATGASYWCRVVEDGGEPIGEIVCGQEVA